MRKLLSLLFLSFMLAQPAAAQALANNQIVERVDAKFVQRILNDMGFTGSQIDEDGDVTVMMQGMEVTLFIDETKTSVQFYFGMRGTDAGLDTVNSWNRTKRYSRAYLDKEGDPILESDLDLEGGVTVARIKDFVKTYGLSLAAFLKVI